MSKSPLRKQATIRDSKKEEMVDEIKELFEQRFNDLDDQIAGFEEEMGEVKEKLDDLPEPLLEQIAKRLNSDLKGYLPRVEKHLLKLKEGNQKNDSKLDEIEEKLNMLVESGVSKDNFDVLRNKVNMMKDELNFFKKNFNKEKIDQIDQNEKQLIEAQADIKELLQNIDKKAN